MATEVFNIVINQRGAKTAATQIRRIGQSSVRSSSSVNLLRRSILSLTAVLGVRELIRFSDSFTDMQNRIRLVTEGSDELKSTFGKLFDVAQSTRAPLDATTELFRRLSINTRDLGFSQEQIIGTIKTINQTLAISGATAQEARAGIIQLSQGFASGQLRGEEFRSVAEQLPRLLIAIADGTGRTIGQLRELAFQGKLSAKEVAEATASQAKIIDEEFKRITPTIQQAGIVLSNAFTKFLGELNETAGTSQSFQKVLFAISENLEDIATGLIGAVSGFIAWGVASRTAAFVTALFSGSLLTLRTALLRTGIGAFVVGVGFAVDAILKFGLSTEKVGDVTVSGFDKIAVGFRALTATFSQLGAILLKPFKPLAAVVSAATANIGKSVTGLVPTFADVFDVITRIVFVKVNLLIGIFLSFFKATEVVLKNFPPLFERWGKESGDFFAFALVDTVNRAIAQLNKIRGVEIDFLGGFQSDLNDKVVTKSFAETANEVGKVFSDNLLKNFVGDFLSESGKAIKGRFSQNFDTEFDKLLADLKARQEEEIAQQAALDLARAEGKVAAVQLEEEAAAKRKRLAAERQLINLTNTLRVAREKAGDPLKGEIEKLDQQRVKILQLAAIIGRTAKAEEALRINAELRLTAATKLNGFLSNQDGILGSITSNLQAISEFSPEYAADMQRAAEALLSQDLSAEELDRKLRLLDQKLVDTRKKREKELRKEGEQFADSFATDLSKVFQATIRGDAVDFAQFLGDQAAKFLDESLKDVFRELTKSFQSLLSNIDGKFGGVDVGGALQAAVGVGGLVLSAFLQDSTADISNELATQSIVTDTTPVRGVVAGDTSVPIFQLGEELQDANGPVVSVLEDILAAITGGASVNEASSLSLEDQAAQDLSLTSPSLF